MATSLDLLNDLGAGGVLEFHADLHDGLAVGEFIQKSERGLFAVEVTRDDYISLAHSLILFFDLYSLFQSANLRKFGDNSNNEIIKLRQQFINKKRHPSWKCRLREYLQFLAVHRTAAVDNLTADV